MKLTLLTSILFIFPFIIQGKLISLKPIKVIGSYNYIQGSIINNFAVYLGQSKLEIYESNNDADDDNLNKEVYLCDVFPVVFRDDTSKSLIINQFTNKASIVNTITGISGSPIINRDKGLYDNLPYGWKGKETKKELYQSLMRISSEQSINPYRTFVTEFSKLLKCKLSGIFVEVVDEYSQNGIAIGGSILLTRNIDDNLSEILSTRPPSSSDEDIDSSSSCFVDCHLDEIISLSMALNSPIYIDDDLFCNFAVDAVLKEKDSILSIEGPVNSPNTNTISNKESLFNGNVPKAWEILDPNLFFKLSTVDKRAVLRASNIKQLPRPREGKKAVDDILLDLMDDAVRQEIFRILAKNPGYKMKSDSVEDDTLSRQQLLQYIGEAIDNNEMDKAVELKRKFSELTSLRADPTQPVGSYDKYLDQDDWYMQQRKRAMQSKRKP